MSANAAESLAVPPRRASWKKLPDGSWGVRVEADDATVYADQTIDVRRRDQSSRPVRLGALVETLENGQAALYTVADAGGWQGGGRRRGRAPSKAAAVVPPPVAPRRIEVSPAEMTTLLDTGTVTTGGVTLEFDGSTLVIVIGQP